MRDEAEGDIVVRSDHESDHETARAAIRLRDVVVRLGNRTVWSGATLDITPGEFVAVLGPNGAGKSTLLRLLLGLLRPSAGHIEVLGQPPRRGSPTIGYVPQRRTLNHELAVRGRELVALGVDGHRWGFALPALSQPKLSHDSPSVSSGRGPKRERVQAALLAVEATAFADRPIGQLSGGEQQRLLLAQALVGRPRLLLLDEPLASLDLRNQGAIAQLVARLARGQEMTTLLVAHDVNPLLPLVDRILYVANGQVAIGRPDEIITTERLSQLYSAPVEVVRDSRGRVFVVGLEDEAAHPHGA